MKQDLFRIALSPIDETRFGIRTAKATHVTLDHLPFILDYCRSHKVQFLIARCATSELKTVQALEQEGFLLMDTLVYYSRNLQKPKIPMDPRKFKVRRIKTGEVDKVMEVAAEAFRGYFGHYHADERLDSSQCDEAYVNWAFNFCNSRGRSRVVLLAEVNHAVVGFITLKLNHSKEGECELLCVSKSFQGKGVSQSLLIKGMEWGLSKKVDRLLISTQIINIASQKVWVRLGFEPSSSYYTFHRWFK